MGLMNEYINKRLGRQGLQDELRGLIKEYNKKTGSYMLVHATAMSRPLPIVVPLNIDDYFIISDMLKDIKAKNLDYYIETPGGSGEAAEEIVKFLHDKFEKVTFVVSGQAMSAGTIMILSGNEIAMTKSGCLGPIDAQLKIGRTQISAYDYMAWIKEKRSNAERDGSLNPLDALMVAQISPGEIGLVDHTLQFAQDRVKEWLPKYKFKNWEETETRKIKVTEKMKEQRAEEIAKCLVDRDRWRTHGRAIKIEDLEEIGLKINHIDDNKEIAIIVYKIQTVVRLLLTGTTIYKLFMTVDGNIFNEIIPASKEPLVPHSDATQTESVQTELTCNKCKKVHKIYAKFVKKPEIDKMFKQKGYIPYPKNNILKCECGNEMNLSPIRNEIEKQARKKIIL